MTDTSLAEQPLWLRILHPLLRLVVLGTGLFAFMIWADVTSQQFHGRPVLNILIQPSLGLLAIAIYFGWGRFIERREVSELSTHGMAREWGVGVLIGVVLYSACAVTLMLLGIYKVQGFNSAAFLLPAVAMAIKSGVFEELIFRGVLHRSVEAIFGSWAGILASSLAFGLIHLVNPGAEIKGAIYISVEAGLLLSAAYLVTRRLWICIGFHMGWNYVQSAIYSGVVSGAVADPGLLQATIEGSDFLTGGSFGMEESILALVYCTTAGIVLLVIAIRRGHILPPLWNR
jgi:hypothetical protein